MTLNCADCDAGLSIPSDAIVGEIVSCKDCGAEFEVAGIEGGTVTLKAAEKADEDWGE